MAPPLSYWQPTYRFTQSDFSMGHSREASRRTLMAWVPWVLPEVATLYDSAGKAIIWVIQNWRAGEYCCLCPVRPGWQNHWAASYWEAGGVVLAREDSCHSGSSGNSERTEERHSYTCCSNWLRCRSQSQEESQFQHVGQCEYSSPPTPPPPPPPQFWTIRFGQGNLKLVRPDAC